MVELTDGLILSPVLDHTPAEHGHGPGHGIVELDGVPCIVVAPNQAPADGAVGEAILHAGIAPPADAIVLWQRTGWHSRRQTHRE